MKSYSTPSLVFTTNILVKAY